MKNILTLVFILYVFLAFSQDKIYKLDGTEVLANIKEVNQTEIKYNKFSNTDGPLYTIEKSEVLMIVYANGETEIFAKKTSPVMLTPWKSIKMFWKNIFSGILPCLI
ncbi:MAG: hypothetical protein IPH89_07445 [Bacteroidetes bacterium]|nr:hypothetical protein [Bacteroidota bacterium]